MNDLKLYTKFINKLYDVANAIHQYESMPRKYGTEKMLFMKEAHTLAIIFENPGITSSEIAEMENKTKSCISQRINRLEKKELIRKEKNSTEYKKTNLFLTEEGKTIAMYHSKLDANNYGKVMQSLDSISSQDFKKFIEVLGKVEESVISDLLIQRGTLKSK